MRALTPRLVLVWFAALALSVGAGRDAEAGPRGSADHPEVGLLAEIEFGEGSSRVPEAAGSQLGRIAAWASDHEGALIVIDGHADARGPAAGNVRLSLRRARLVRDQLLALGVDPSQIIISAFGAEGRPHARVTVWGTDGGRSQVTQRPAFKRPLEGRYRSTN